LEPDEVVIVTLTEYVPVESDLILAHQFNPVTGAIVAFDAGGLDVNVHVAFVIAVLSPIFCTLR
jgi:hypothetical protein